jgi:hypothetical protein
MRRWAVLLVVMIGWTISAVSQQVWIERQYHWEYAQRTWSLTHRFSAALYRTFAAAPRVLDYAAYGAYACDPRDDAEIQSLIAALESLAAGAGLNVWEKLNLIVAFVQSIPYASEEGEYPRYPLETLIDQRGDCEDAAILTAALLEPMGFGVVLLAFVEERHMAVGVRVLPPGAGPYQAYQWNGDAYYFLEPTSVGWQIGEMPVQYASQPTIVDLRPMFASSARQ